VLDEIKLWQNLWRQELSILGVDLKFSLSNKPFIHSGITREILLRRKAAKLPNLRILTKPPQPKTNFGENLLCGFGYVYGECVGVLRSVRSWGRWALTAVSTHSAPSNIRKMSQCEGFN